MSLLAVSAGLILAGGPQRLQKAEQLVWQTTQRSVAVIMKGGIPIGDAALIDRNGLFIATQSAVSTPTMQARLSDGKVVTLDWKATDVPTQTVLLQAEDWSPDDGVVVSLPTSEIRVDHGSVPVLVVLPSGPVPGELLPSSKVGIISSSKRAYKLGEVRFEASALSVAGALVFNRSGALVGMLNATLADDEPQEGTRRVTVPLKHADGQGVQNQLVPSNFAATKNFGPADQTVGYTVGPEVLRRIVTGFLSPDHKVKHPAIGVNCQNGPSLGALIITVKPGSAAEKAGLQPGDIIVRLDDTVVKNQIDFAMYIQTKDPGDPLTITVTRDGVPHTYHVIVGTIQKAQMNGAPVGSG